MLNQQNFETNMINDLKEIYNKEANITNDVTSAEKYSDEDLLLSNQNDLKNYWKYENEFEMFVPNHIAVVDYNQYVETCSVPLEIQLDNSISMPRSPCGDIRMPTPPYKITLNDYYPPTLLETKIASQKYTDDSIGVSPMPMDSPRLKSDIKWMTIKNDNTPSSVLGYNLNDTSIVSHCESVAVENLSLAEQILYLKRQLGTLKRRVLNIEVSNRQRMQREKIIYCMGLTYFFIRALYWLKSD